MAYPPIVVVVVVVVVIFSADVDFQSGDYKVTFKAGETNAMAIIKLINDDFVELSEEFIVSIVGLPENFYVIAGQSLFVNIIDDESEFFVRLRFMT